MNFSLKTMPSYLVSITDRARKVEGFRRDYSKNQILGPFTNFDDALTEAQRNIRANKTQKIRIMGQIPSTQRFEVVYLVK